MPGLFAVAESAATESWVLYYAHRIDRLCWLVFCVVWLTSWFSARRPIKRSQSLATRVLQIALYGVGIVLLFVNRRILPPSVEDRLLAKSDTLTVVATLLTVVGIAFAIWARGLLGSNWSARVTLKEGHELIQAGPYRFVRHPIYAGLLVALAGRALLRCSPRSLLGLAVFLAAFIWKVRMEERFLTAEFGEKYLDYRRRVKALVPFVI